MKSFTKKYKYILILFFSIIIFSYICYKNYNIIEKFSCNSNISTPIILTDPNVFSEKHMEKNGNIESYFTLSTSPNSLNCFSSVEPSAQNILFSDICSNTINNSNNITFEELVHECINQTENFAGDFFTINDNGLCNSYSFNELAKIGISYENNIDYSLFINTPINITNTSELNNICLINENIYDSSGNKKNINSLGYGGLSLNGINKIQNQGLSKMIKYYNPLCIVENNINNLSISISNCDNDTSFNIYMDELSEQTLLFNSKLDSINPGNFYSIDSTYECKNNEEHCISSAFNLPDTLLNNTYNKIETVSISDISKNLNTELIKDYKNELAIENESSLNTKSITMQYLILIVIFIISVIMIILNITNPDIITAEILTGYILLIILIIFITSRFFNVDYGIFNKFFTLHLGSAGSRNNFESS